MAIYQATACDSPGASGHTGRKQAELEGGNIPGCDVGCELSRPAWCQEERKRGDPLIAEAQAVGKARRVGVLLQGETDNGSKKKGTQMLKAPIIPRRATR